MEIVNIPLFIFWVQFKKKKKLEENPDVLYAFYFLIQFLSIEGICLGISTVKPLDLSEGTRKHSLHRGLIDALP